MIAKSVHSSRERARVEKINAGCWETSSRESAGSGQPGHGTQWGEM